MPILTASAAVAARVPLTPRGQRPGPDQRASRDAPPARGDVGGGTGASAIAHRSAEDERAAAAGSRRAAVSPRERPAAGAAPSAGHPLATRWRRDLSDAPLRLAVRRRSRRRLRRRGPLG